MTSRKRVNYTRRPHANGVSYDARQVATAYSAPLSQYDGSGVTVGIVELGGAYNAGDLGTMGLNAGNVTVVAVDNARPKSDGPNGADGEVMLDIEVVAAIAPGAKIRCYFAPNTDAGFLDAIVAACNDCQIVSISWGGPETSWTTATVKAYAAALAAARARGVTVFAASGDSGSRDGTRANTTDYPASDPSVVGCGGTRLLLAADGSRSSEVTWNDSPTQSATGGGVSRLFPGRQVPDVAGNADPVTGYNVVIDGQSAVIGGTSAVAPLYAGCTALLLQALGKPFDFLSAVTSNPTVCYDVTVGNNGGYRAGPGRDMTTGLGVVDFGKLLTVLQGGTVVTPPSGGGGGTPPSSGDAVALLTSINSQISAFLAANAPQHSGH